MKPSLLSRVAATTAALLPLLFAPSPASAQDIVQTIPAFDAYNVRFGSSLAMDATTLVVGDHERARPSATCPIGYGGFTVYKKVNNVWQASQNFVANPAETGEAWFGHWLSLRNNVLVVGSNREDGPGNMTNAGAFYVYRRSTPSANFVQVGAKVIAPNAAGFNEGSGPPMTPVTNGTLIANSHLDQIHLYRLLTNGVSFITTLTLPVPSRVRKLFLTDRNPATDTSVLVALYDTGDTLLAWRIVGNTVTPINMAGTPPLFHAPWIMSGDGNTVVVVNRNMAFGPSFWMQVLNFSGGSMQIASSHGLPLAYSAKEPVDVLLRENQAYFVVYPNTFAGTFITGAKYYNGAYHAAGALHVPGFFSELGSASSGFGQFLYRQGQAIAFNGVEIAIGDRQSPSWGSGCPPTSGGGSVSILRPPTVTASGPGGGTLLRTWLPNSSYFLGESVARNGQFIAAGTRYPGWEWHEQGVTLFKNVNGSWQQAARFIDGWAGFLGSTTATEFGGSVDLNDENLVIGAPVAYSQTEGKETGAVYLARATNGEFPSSFTLPQIPTPGGASAGESIGWSVALSGNTLVSGAPAFALPWSTGIVDVYDLTDPFNPILRQSLTPPDGTGNDLFGYSVDINGDYLIVGAPQNRNAQGTMTGAAYIYRLVNGSWTLSTKVTSANASDGSYLGSDVSISPVVGGVAHAAAAGYGTGIVTMRRLSGTSWLADGEITSGGTFNFGSSVSVDATRLVIASSWEGRVYRYARGSGGWTRTGTLSNMPGVGGTDMKGTSVVVGATGAMIGDFFAGAPLSLSFSQIQ